MKESESVVKLAKDLVSLNSDRPNNTEEKVAQYIFDYLKDIGLNPEKQVFDEKNDLFNVIVLGSPKASLMINGHMDTVPTIPEQWKYNYLGELVDGKLYGRGSSDTKGNIACVLAAMKEHFNENIAYIFNIDEEQSLTGIKKVLELKKNKIEKYKIFYFIRTNRRKNYDRKQRMLHSRSYCTRKGRP